MAGPWLITTRFGSNSYPVVVNFVIRVDPLAWLCRKVSRYPHENWVLLSAVEVADGVDVAWCVDENGGEPGRDASSLEQKGGSS